MSVTTETRIPRLLLVASLLVGTGATGCGGGAAEDTAGSEGTDGTDEGGEGESSGEETGISPMDAEALAELEGCQGDATDEEVLEALVISDAYAESLHEMIGCGALNARLCAGVIEGIFRAMVEQSNDATPPGWEYVGDGSYYTASETVSMEMSFYVAEDFVFAQSGEKVIPNVFLVDSYLVGAEVVLNTTDFTTSLRYDAPGPLVELLGLGENPPNPIPFDINDLAGLQTKLRALEFEGQVVVTDDISGAEIDYEMHVLRAPAGALIDVPFAGLGNSRAMIYELLDVDGERPSLGQTLITSNFDVGYANHGTLEGTVDFTVEGDAFEYGAHLVWDDTPLPERTLSCVE